MLYLRLFASAVLFISLLAGVICVWTLFEIGTSFTGMHEHGVLLHSFDLRDWNVLVAWSCVGFLLGGVTSALALLARKPWSRGMLVGSVVFASIVAAVDWLLAGAPIEILSVIASGTAAVISWWLLYRYLPVSNEIVRRPR